MPIPLVEQLYYPIVLTKAGVTPQLPADLRQQLVNLVTYGTDPLGNQVMTPLPGYTAALPGSLIEDMASTATGALILCDQARVELINSLTPYGANSFLIAQLGMLFGLQFGTTTNVSVNVVFTGTVGFFIQSGFTVGDGTNTYILQQAGIIQSSGQSASLLAVSPIAGSWPVPPGTVTQIVSSVPSSITLAVTNALEGTGGNTQETEQAYRVRVQQASIVGCKGTPAMVKTLLQEVPGVSPQQVAVLSQGANWEVICGGSSPDQYAIAQAIYQGVCNIGTLIGSTMSLSAVTRANPGVVTTVLNHGYSNNQVVTFSGVGGMTNLNTGNYTITVVDEKNFSIGVNTTAFPAYTGGGQVLPNLRNNTPTINDYPDIYTIPFVTPPQQTVSVVLTWHALGNVAAEGVIDQLAQTAVVNTINAIPVGNPINLLALQEQVLIAIAPQISLDQVTGMDWEVAINNVPAPPEGGLSIILGDPESYFSTTSSAVTVTKS